VRKGVVVPVVEATGGTERLLLQSDLVTLAAEYCLSVGLSLMARETVKTLKEKEPEFLNPTYARRFMLWRETQEQELELFDLELAIASLREASLLFRYGWM